MTEKKESVHPTPPPEAIDWALRKFLDEKTDKQIADGLHVSEAQITARRLELGLERKKETLKQYARRRLQNMTESEKEAFVFGSGISKEMIWKMGEGQPATTGTLEISQEPIRIDITHQLLKVYGPDAARVITQMSTDGEALGLPAGSGE